MVSCVASNQGSRKSSGLESLVKDAANKYSILDIALIMPQPAQCCRPLSIERVVWWSKVWWSFELGGCKASYTSSDSCLDQVYLVGTSDCGDDGVDAAERVLQVVGVVVVHYGNLKTTSSECGFGLRFVLDVTPDCLVECDEQQMADRIRVFTTYRPRQKYHAMGRLFVDEVCD